MLYSDGLYYFDCLNLWMIKVSIYLGGINGGFNFCLFNSFQLKPLNQGWSFTYLHP